MAKVYFFCDSQRNILSAYFMRKLYFTSDKYESELLVSNNSKNSVLCADRIKKTEKWDKVDIIKEAFQDKNYLEKIIEQYEIKPGDIVGIFALQNRFARALYQLASRAGATIMLIDEGVVLFDDFLKWQREHRDEMFAEIDILSNPITAWCYEPRMYKLPSNFTVKKINIKKYLDENISQIEEMRLEVKEIFNVQKETNRQIIYFDQYYALSGRAMATIEQYFLRMVATICSDFDFAIKPHPMERGFSCKYRSINASIMESQSSPWEAIYFVNYFKKGNKKLICIAGESTAISSPLLMFGDNNYRFIALKDIYKRYISSSTLWSPDEYFNTLKELYGENFYMPQDFGELSLLIKQMMGSINVCEQDLLNLSEAVLGQMSKEMLFYKPTVIIPCLQIWSNDTLIEELKVEQVLEDSKFELIYEIPSHLQQKNIKYRWIPHRNCYVRFKDLQIEFFRDGVMRELPIEEFTSEQVMKLTSDGYYENVSYNPSFAMNLHQIVVEKIKISGKWKFDFKRERILTDLEIFNNQKLNIQKSEYEEKEKQLKEKINYLQCLIKKQEDTISVLKDNVHILKENNEDLVELFKTKLKFWKIK